MMVSKDLGRNHWSFMSNSLFGSEKTKWTGIRIRPVLVWNWAFLLDCSGCGQDEGWDASTSKNMDCDYDVLANNCTYGCNPSHAASKTHSSATIVMPTTELKLNGWCYPVLPLMVTGAQQKDRYDTQVAREILQQNHKSIEPALIPIACVEVALPRALLKLNGLGPCCFSSWTERCRDTRSWSSAQSSSPLGPSQTPKLLTKTQEIG